jgi:hypothetical protein
MPEVIIIGTGVIGCSIAYQTPPPRLLRPDRSGLAMTGAMCHSEPQLVGKKNLPSAQVCPEPSRRSKLRLTNLTPDSRLLTSFN